MQKTHSDRHLSLVQKWATVMRLPFTTVAVVPFAVGVYLAFAHGVLVSRLSAALGMVSVFFICIGCYLLGEVYDQKEDLKTITYGRTMFSGGTLLVANGVLSVRPVKAIAAALFGISAVFGVVIYLIQGTLLTFALGGFGVASAVFYSMPLARLVMRGIGELLIAVCYGWLTVVAGYLCASGSIPPFSYYYTIPIALTIFNVILINEFPDYEADRESGKFNLLARIGKPAGSFVYSAAALLTVISLVVIWVKFRNGSYFHLLAVAPGAILGVMLAVNVALRKRWKRLETLEPVCGLTIVLNHVASITVGALAIWR